MEIGRNSIIIRNVDFNSKNFEKFSNRLSLYDPVYHKYVFSAFTIVNQDVYIPGSVGKFIVKNYFPDEEEQYIYNMTAKTESIDINLVHQPKDDLQKQSIDFLMKMKKDKFVRERMLSLKTGSGKTYVTINFVTQMKKKAMIIVDTLDLASQWKGEFIKHTDIDPSKVIILSGKESIEKELRQKKEDKGYVYIAIHRTLQNLIEENSKNINKLMNDLRIGIRVFDECHVEYRNICQINALSNVEYTILLSATPNRSNFNDDSLYGRIFRNIPYFNGKELNQEKYHTVILTKFNSNPPLEVKGAIKTKYGFSGARWANYICEEAYEKLYDHVYTLIDKLGLVQRGKKTFIMLPTLNLIQKMKEDLENEFRIDVGTFIGEIRKDKRKDELEKMLVLTNDKIFDKGIDVPDLEVLINCVPLGSLVKTEQIIGRLRYKENKSSILIDVTDYGFIECVNQSKIRKRFYKKKAKIIKELN